MKLTMSCLRQEVLICLCACIFAASCNRAPAITSEWKDNFDRADLGDDWRTTGGPYRIIDGRLNVKGARNKPLWLKRKLPRDVEIELTVESRSPSGDIKVEVFGDGESYARELSYTATSYVFNFGGWNNQKSQIAKRDEHGPESVARTDVRVEMGRKYRWKIRRKGNEVAWFIDDQPFLTYQDPSPLAGQAHEHFAFNNWDSDLYFDDLVIRPL
jgi:hypothetical protein